MKHGRSAYVKGCRCEVCRSAHRDYMREYLRSKREFKPVTQRCERCGGEFTRQRAGDWTRKRFCSRKCQNAAANGIGLHVKARALRRRAQATAAKAANGTSSTRIWVQGCCAECGRAFPPSPKMTIFCSSRCKAHASSARRRARQAGMKKISPIRRFRVHERDNWTCHICGDPVNRAAKVPELDAPVLDHIVALAAGGAHAEDNLKTAHFYCNSVKRDLPLAAIA